MNSRVTNKRILELDALRGLAAILVVFFHVTINNDHYSFFKFGTTGVDLFFLISGFVIFMSIQNINKGIDFIINRISRLYPTYWTAVTITFLLILLKSSYDGVSFNINLVYNFIVNLSMFQFYFRVQDLDGPYWTLVIEMLFYIFILIVFKLKLLNHLNVIGITICLIVVLSINYDPNSKLIKGIIWWIPLLQFMPLFLAGTVFYKLYQSKENQLQNYLIIVSCLLCQVALFPFVGRSFHFINQFEYFVLLCSYNLLFVLFVNKKLVFIINKFSIFLGTISYSLYLIHQYLSTKILIPYFCDQLGINFWIVVIFINLPIVIGLSALITYKVEIPYSKLMKEKLRTLV